MCNMLLKANAAHSFRNLKYSLACDTLTTPPDVSAVYSPYIITMQTEIPSRFAVKGLPADGRGT